jgi:cytidine diphosphoramidate kinase
MVIWIMGLSGAGKTTIGRMVFAALKEHNPATVFVDGDEIREVFRHNRGEDAYAPAGRRVAADRLAALCTWLDRQGIDVVCCCLSYFDEVSRQNRATFSRYFEVFVDVPFPTLLQREIKNLYGPALRGEIRNVVGVDIPFTAPTRPDLVVNNAADGIENARAAAGEILARAMPAARSFPAAATPWPMALPGAA